MMTWQHVESQSETNFSYSFSIVETAVWTESKQYDMQIYSLIYSLIVIIQIKMIRLKTEKSGEPIPCCKFFYVNKLFIVTFKILKSADIWTEKQVKIRKHQQQQGN